MIGLDGDAVLDLRHGHRRSSGEDGGKVASVLRVQVKNNHESGAGFCWHRLEEGLKRLNAAGRSANRHDGDPRGFIWSAGLFWIGGHFLKPTPKSMYRTKHLADTP